MPFGAVDRPALGISLLKAGLVRRGHDCDIAYALELFARRIGTADYRWLADEVPYTCFAGDWCFAEALYGPRPEEDWKYVHDILLQTWAMRKTDVHRVLNVKGQVNGFLEDCLRSYDWHRYDIVGFTSTFVQNLASLALAKRLKESHPHISIVFGGANWEDKMGQALFECFPFVDYVCQGEADESFPDLVDALATGGDAGGVNGVLSRDGVSMPARPVSKMDGLPVPDFDDFFEMHAHTAPDVAPQLLMETSRGCWWGAKHHCTFCGLNGQGMAFRSKSPDRVIEEFDSLVTRHDVQVVSMVDNILDMNYFTNVLPKLADLKSDHMIFFETKANLNRHQVELLARAGVSTIQPGIESLSDRILKLMRKGTTALRNIQLLKWCQAHGVSVEWNILYGFPGETDEDYEEMLRMFPALSHLQPPSGSGPVRVDRFSPYFNAPEEFGLSNLRPLPVFRHLYPYDEQTQAQIACYFEADYERASCASPAIVERLLAAIETWRSAEPATLWVEDDGRSLKIFDKRDQDSRFHEIREIDRIIYLLADEVTTVSKLSSELKKLNLGRFKQSDISDLLEYWVELGIMISKGGKYLALAVNKHSPQLSRGAIAAEQRAVA